MSDDHLQLGLCRFMTMLAVAFGGFLIAAATSGCDTDTATTARLERHVLYEGPSWDAFLGAAEPFGAGFIVDGDIYVPSEEELRTFYETHVRQRDGELGALVLSTKNNSDNTWSTTQRQDLSFCVDETAFNNYRAGYGAWARQFALGAAADWNCTTNVNFHEDCDSPLFDIVPMNTPGVWGMGFFPDMSERSVQLGVQTLGYGDEDAPSPIGTLRHEFGHVLGYLHEFNHSSYSGTCDEDYAGAGYGKHEFDYDQNGVMHYTDCGSANTSFRITSTDATEVQEVYGAPPEAPPPSGETCSNSDVRCDGSLYVLLCSSGELTRVACWDGHTVCNEVYEPVPANLSFTATCIDDLYAQPELRFPAGYSGPRLEVSASSFTLDDGNATEEDSYYLDYLYTQKRWYLDGPAALTTTLSTSLSPSFSRCVKPFFTVLPEFSDHGFLVTVTTDLQQIDYSVVADGDVGTTPLEHASGKKKYLDLRSGSMLEISSADWSQVNVVRVLFYPLGDFCGDESDDGFFNVAEIVTAMSVML
jgi:serralysin